ncbi:HAMP domain-containing sensor histidine kinase [Paenibacillus sp. MMS20-IR301]|uniref:HAMP domain-containing sensor histidine kinase n=1 Tax=Paenibacillus sp. MMS20-IR301 TaxID=2895946 RepID=UPI0028E7F78B|nr:HAMP domain-containing sensor histidine kinase [Paenibacillus sp. MMS20-IR301]WNS40726.1 HAMP domain-containing sensor histidine kinase [Paenibacillus sp. MMS20-IR301]
MMRIKRVTAVFVALLIIGVSAVLYSFYSDREPGLDLVAVNDITETLAEHWGSREHPELPGLQYGLDYVVLDLNGGLAGATRRGLNETVDAAVRNRDTIVDISQDGTRLGQLIIYNHTDEKWNLYKDKLFAYIGVILVCIALFCMIYAEYIDRAIFRPFRKLQAFARHVAEGKLDMPLEMDRGNGFGAFAESFDLMREELAKARENERAANQSKKELVASLSHDIKTPLASIKAVTEVMLVKAAAAADKRQLEVINAKADQINTLITNMFSATLEELQELSVTVTEQPSGVLADMIRQADYNSLAVIAPVPECLIAADIQRIIQVIDNVISNAYKYAGTSISVSSSLEGAFLEIAFRDYGQGVDPGELPLLCNKFYRAGNAAGKSGTGLGLYICQYLMARMSGSLSCSNVEGGFMVRLQLPVV